MAKTQNKVPTPDQTGVAQGSEPISQASDTTFTVPPRALWVSVTGTIVCRLIGDTIDSTWANVPAGFWAAAVQILRSTGNGTTATVTQAVY
jgi:hypothetical protein